MAKKKRPEVGTPEYYADPHNRAYWLDMKVNINPINRQCWACVHWYEGERACAAYPGAERGAEDIPYAIWANRFDHRFPYPGDDGVVFEQDPDKPEFDHEHEIGRLQRGLGFPDDGLPDDGG